MQESISHEAVLHFQSAYAAMVSELERIQEEKRNLVVEREAELSIVCAKLQQKSSYFESVLWDKNKRIGEMEETIKRLQSQENEKNRREMRRYIESNNEKEAENNSLKRQINSLKNKINSLETEVANIANIKEDLELFILKGIEQLRIANKEITTNIDETDTQKLVMDSKYKQTHEKINMLTERITQLEIKLRNAEELLAHARSSLKQSKDDSLSQKFEIERLKEQIRTLKLNENLGSRTSEDDDYLASEVGGIVQLGSLLREREGFLKQVGEYHEMSLSLVEENHSLKVRMSELQEHLDQLKAKYESGYQDAVLKKSDLSLFQYLQDKKNHFLNFEQTIEKIETYIEEKDEAINNLITTFNHRKNQCICGKEAQLSKLHSQMAKVQSELEPLMKKTEHYEEVLVKLRKDLSSYQKYVETYRTEIREILTEGKGKARKKAKKRCLNCMISFEKNEFTESCQDCKKSYHVHCINDHRCELYKLQDGFSCMSGADI